MTKEERAQMGRLLDEIDRGILPGPKGIMARVSATALRALLTNSHGASNHAAPAGTKPRRTRSAPAPVGGPA
jgi:hypothetical protein